MDYLAQLAAKGHTCIATIHAPRTAIWAKFHKVGAVFPSLAQHQSGDMGNAFSHVNRHPSGRLELGLRLAARLGRGGMLAHSARAEVTWPVAAPHNFSLVQCAQDCQASSPSAAADAIDHLPQRAACTW